MSIQTNDPAEFLPRRRPSQERSRRRFDDILRAARALLVEVGFESFTSEQVALRAGVPIGSLYQFFGNKYAIICELDRLDTVNVQAELEKFAGEIPSLDWLDPSPPLKSPDYQGLKSHPEYGIRIGPASLDALRRYAWTDEATRSHLA